MGEFIIEQVVIWPTAEFYTVRSRSSKWNYTIRDLNANGNFYDDRPIGIKDYQEAVIFSLTEEQRAELHATIKKFKTDDLPALLRKARKHVSNYSANKHFSEVKNSWWAVSGPNDERCSYHKGPQAKAYSIKEEHSAGCDVVETWTHVRAVDRNSDGHADGVKVETDDGVVIYLVLDYEKYDPETNKCSGVKGSIPWLSMYDFLFSEGR